MAGEIKNFTGVDQAYEVPENPELRLSAGEGDPAALADQVVAELLRHRIF
jgi:bifunctional enzyme CysN/CysC